MDMSVSEVRARLQRADARELAALERSLAADERKGVHQALERARRRIRAEEAEARRLSGIYEFERSLLPAGGRIVVGLDEVGRGAVAGPLAVGAVVLPEKPLVGGLDDSKRLAPEKRAEVAQRIESAALAWAVEYVDAQVIDAEGMSAVLRRAFAGALRAVEQSGVQVDVVLVDGNPLGLDPREVNVVKGDSKCASIAAASIVAKVHRDALMTSLAPRYEAYGFDVNKGYASPHHIEAIKAFGLSDIHRASFCRSFAQQTLF